MVERSGESGSVGDLVEFRRIVVVQDDVETEEVFDNGERMFGDDGGESAIGDDKDGDSLTAVDLVSESSLLQVVAEIAVLRVVFEHVSNIVGGDDGRSGGEGEEEEKGFGGRHWRGERGEASL